MFEGSVHKLNYNGTQVLLAAQAAAEKPSVASLLLKGLRKQVDFWLTGHTDLLAHAWH